MAFAATLVDEWVRAGVTDAVCAPGSRSTPLTVACTEDARLTVHMVLDERSASFLALGLALASGRPTVLVCTSGTAAAHFHGAVVEAAQAGVPLIVCTADRPPELRDVGAPQTIDQIGLFSSAVRWSTDPGVPDLSGASTWRSLGARAFLEATGRHPGPVHLNLSFREPLLSDVRAPVPEGRADGRPWHRRAVATVVHEDRELTDLIERARRPVVVAGRGAPPVADPGGVPVLGDPRSSWTISVPHADSLLRCGTFVADHEPDLIVMAGELPASKTVTRWVATSSAPKVALLPARGWVDPDHVVDIVVDGPLPTPLHGSPEWNQAWSDAAARASAAVTATMAAGDGSLSGPAVARAVTAAVPDGGALFMSSSMPIRDVEWFASPRAGVQVFANRGANGIDGIVSSATGVALATGAPTVLLTGDLAFLHDTNGLLGLAERAVHLTIVVVDNGGGGIFSLLPQRGLLEPATFTSLYTTPQRVDLAALVTAHHLPVAVVSTVEELEAALSASARTTGTEVVIARTDTARDVALHETLHRAVADALR